MLERGGGLVRWVWVGTRIGVKWNVRLGGAKRRSHIGLEGTLIYGHVGSEPNATLNKVDRFQKELLVAGSTCPHFVWRSSPSMPDRVSDQRDFLAPRSLDLHDIISR
jgi:hypothetical protein